MTHDLIIIGAGSAGLTASLFASRYQLDHRIFGETPGGQIMDAHVVENYPGFSSIAGEELVGKFVQQVEEYGVTVDARRVSTLTRDGEVFTATLDDGEEVVSRSVLLAMGAKHRSLNVPGEEDLLGKGVLYSAADAADYAGKTVAVVGGGDSACTGALKFAEHAKQVYLIHRRPAFRAEPTWVEKVRAAENIQIITNNIVMAVGGEEEVQWIDLRNPVESSHPERSNAESKDLTPSEGHEISRQARNDNNPNRLAVDAVLITIGLMPAVDLAHQIGVTVDAQHYITVGPDLATNIPGVFAAGDLALQPGGLVYRQIITSAGEGALATAALFHYLNGKPPAPNWS